MKCGLLNQGQACDKVDSRHLYLTIPTPTFGTKAVEQFRETMELL